LINSGHSAMTSKSDSSKTLLSSHSVAVSDDFVVVRRSALSDAPVSDDVSLVNIENLQKPKLTRQSGVYKPDFADEKKVDKEDSPRLASLLRGMKMKGIARLRTKLHHGGTLLTPATGKYQWQFSLTGGSPSTSLVPNDITNGGEWTSFNSVFEEFFVHAMEVKFEPFNQNMAGYVSSTSTNAQTSGLTIAGYQHDQPAVTDANTNYYQMMNSDQHSIKHSGRPWTWTWRNIVKFDPRGLANSATGWQGWMNTGDAAAYGGRVMASGQLVGGTAAGSVLSASANAGTVFISFDISWRFRD